VPEYNGKVSCDPMTPMLSYSFVCLLCCFVCHSTYKRLLQRTLIFFSIVSTGFPKFALDSYGIPGFVTASEWFLQVVKSREDLVELTGRGILYEWSCYSLHIRCAARWSIRLYIDIRDIRKLGGTRGVRFLSVSPDGYDSQGSELPSFISQTIITSVAAP